MYFFNFFLKLLPFSFFYLKYYLFFANLIIYFSFNLIIHNTKVQNLFHFHINIVHLIIILIIIIKINYFINLNFIHLVFNIYFIKLKHI